MVRVTGNLSLDGNSITLTQGGNSTTLQGGSPSGDITITLPSTSAPILVNPMDSAGDMMYGGASGTITKLDAGTANYMLQANGAAAPTWNLITNANVDASAAIALSKLATVAVSRALVSDSSGNISAATTTSTQIGYLSSSTGTTGTTSTNIVFSTSPTLVAPVLGAATATSINKVAITAPATGSTLTIADGKTLTASNTLTLTGTDASSVAFGTGGTVAYQGGTLAQFASTTSAQLAGVLSDETGSGSAVFANTPTLITPVLGVATATSVNKVAFTAPATAATLTLADGSTLATSGANSITLTSSGATNVTLPTTGTLATLAGTEALTNKDYQGGTASNSSRITVPSAAKATLDALTRKEATIVYATDTDRLYVDDGSTLNEVGSSTGAGEKNYVTNPSAAATIGNWTAVGDLDVARTTTAADLPREYTTASGIKITADSNTQSTADYVYYDFTLDDVDLSKKLKIQWSQKTTGTYNAGDLAVVITTQADRTTALITPQVTAIPAADTVFTTTFDSTTTATLSLVIRATTDMTTNGGITISDVVVGPGLPVQGAAIGEWQSFTPTGTWSTNTTYTGKYRRVGDSMELSYKLALAGAPTSATLDVNMPTGFTIDTTKIADASANGDIKGLVQILDSGTANYVGIPTYLSNSSFRIRYMDDGASGLTYASVTQAAPMTFASGDSIAITITALPIAEWAGSGTVNLGQSDVEYASNSSSTDADDTTSFIYGPNGSQGVFNTTTLTATRNKRVRFQTPIQDTDSIILELKDPTSNKWVPAAQGNRSGNFNGMVQNTTVYGLYFQGVNSTDVDVTFGQYSRTSGATYGSAGTNWSAESAWRWRVKKFSGGQVVGFALADATNSGLVSTTTQTFAGVKSLPGRTDGSIYSTGYIGEIIPSNYVASGPTTGTTNSPTTATYYAPTSITLTAGNWMVYCKATFSSSTVPTVTSFAAAPTTNSTGTGFGSDAAPYYATGINLTTGLAIGTAFAMTANPTPRFYSVSGSTTVNLLVWGAFTGGTSLAYNGYIYAVRVG